MASSHGDWSRAGGAVSPLVMPPRVIRQTGASCFVCFASRNKNATEAVAFFGLEPPLAYCKAAKLARTKLVTSDEIMLCILVVGCRVSQKTKVLGSLQLLRKPC